MGAAVRKKLALAAKEAIKEDFLKRSIEIAILENKMKNETDPKLHQIDLHLHGILKKELEEHTQAEILQGRNEVVFVNSDTEAEIKKTVKPKAVVKQAKKTLRRQVKFTRRQAIQSGTFVSNKEYLVAAPDKHGKMFTVTNKCPEFVLNRQGVSVGSLVLLVTGSKFDFCNENQFVTVLMPGGKMNDCFKFSWLEPINQDPPEE
jgi:hypothetical protein